MDGSSPLLMPSLRRRIGRRFCGSSRTGRGKMYRLPSDVGIRLETSRDPVHPKPGYDPPPSTGSREGGSSPGHPSPPPSSCKPPDVVVLAHPMADVPPLHLPPEGRRRWKRNRGPRCIRRRGRCADSRPGCWRTRGLPGVGRRDPCGSPSGPELDERPSEFVIEHQVGEVAAPEGGPGPSLQRDRTSSSGTTE